MILLSLGWTAIAVTIPLLRWEPSVIGLGPRGVQTVPRRLIWALPCPHLWRPVLSRAFREKQPAERFSSRPEAFGTVRWRGDRPPARLVRLRPAGVPGMPGAHRQHRVVLRETRVWGVRLRMDPCSCA